MQQREHGVRATSKRGDVEELRRPAKAVRAVRKIGGRNDPPGLSQEEQMTNGFDHRQGHHARRRLVSAVPDHGRPVSPIGRTARLARGEDLDDERGHLALLGVKELTAAPSPGGVHVAAHGDEHSLPDPVVYLLCELFACQERDLVEERLGGRLVRDVLLDRHGCVSRRREVDLRVRDEELESHTCPLARAPGRARGGSR